MSVTSFCQKYGVHPIAFRSVLAALASAIFVSMCGCGPRLRAFVAPPSLGLDGPATYAAYLANEPPRFKMRHTVESTFGSRREVIEGFFVAQRPDRFFVLARSPMGIGLFDVKSVPPAPLEVTAHVAQLGDPRLAQFLARDIRRIYMQECPADAAVQRAGEKDYVVRCSVAAAAGEEFLPEDGPDDAVELHLGLGAELTRKVFSRAGQVTATISYDDYRQVAGVWLPHFIELVHATQPYALRIVLLATDFDFDTSRILGSPGSQASSPTASPTQAESPPQ